MIRIKKESMIYRERIKKKKKLETLDFKTRTFGLHNEKVCLINDNLFNL